MPAGFDFSTSSGSTVQLVSEKGQADGYASLDADGRIPAAQVGAALIPGAAANTDAGNIVEFDTNAQSWRLQTYNFDATDKQFLLQYNSYLNAAGTRVWEDATQEAVTFALENDYLGQFEFNIDLYPPSTATSVRPWAFLYTYATGVGAFGLRTKPAGAGSVRDSLKFQLLGSGDQAGTVADVGFSIYSKVNSGHNDFELDFMAMIGSDDSTSVARLRRVGAQSQLFLGPSGAEYFTWSGVTPNLLLQAKAGQTNVQRVLTVVGSNGDQFCISGSEALPDWAGGSHTTATATAGAATLPANPVGFLKVLVGNAAYRVPYYNV